MAEIGKDIAKAKSFLIAGQPIAIPTETVYGLAANARDSRSVARVFAIKKRPFFDPLIVHVASANSVAKYVQSIPSPAKKLMDAFWPGPLTIVLKKRQVIPDMVTSGMDTVAVRCPRSPLTYKLLQQLPFPLAAPSANLFGYISPTMPEHVEAHLGHAIPYILDGGNCEVGVESTIVGFDTDPPTLYRPGGIDRASIEKLIGPILIQRHTTVNVIAPGSLSSHYAPRTRMLLGDINTLAKRFAGKPIAALCFRNFSDAILPEYTRLLSPSGNLAEAASRLFALLRQLDQMDIDIILSEKVPNVGIGVAINDRLERAAFGNKV